MLFKRGTTTRRFGRRVSLDFAVEPLEARRVLAGDLELTRFESAVALETFLLDDGLARWEPLFGQPAWIGRWFDFGPEGEIVLTRNTVDDSAAAPPEQPSHSETNVQVAGVDEDDIVETDGNFLYILSGPELVIANSWMPTEMQVVSRVGIEGQPVGQFLKNDRLTVISNTFDAWRGGPPIDIVAVDAVAPIYHWNPPRTTITIFDVADRSAPKIVNRTELDGWYVDSRAIGDYVYLITSDQFGLPEPQIKCETTPDMDDPPGDDRLPGDFTGKCVYETKDEYVQRVSGQILELGVPHYTNTDATGQVVETGFVSQPTDIYEPVSPEHWNLLTISTFQMTSGEPGPTSSTSVPTTYATTVYGSIDSLYLTNPEWKTDTQQEATAILKFDIAPTGNRVDLSAVGQVPGRVLNSFSMDELNDSQGNEYFRIATTSGFGNTTDNRVFVMRDVGDELRIIGRTKSLAPGEQIFSARFVGTTAYVVTFRQVDPLFAIDLSIPTDPQVLGDLHIPGFSNYLQPLRDDFLVGLGRNADPNTGRVQELQISLFDVANLASPRLADRYSFKVPGWAWTEALSDHHAISYFPEYQVLALPISNDGYISVDRNGDGVADIQTYRPRTDLYVFRIDLPAAGAEQREAKLQFLGTVEDDAQVRRSVRIEQFLYSISDNSISVHLVLDPKTLVAELHYGQEDVGVPVYSADREASVVRAAIETPQRVAPVVLDVIAGSTQWDHDFVNYLEADGLVSIAANPLSILPFASTDQIKIKFSEDVFVGLGDLTVIGKNQAEYPFREFTYDADTAMATWTLTEPIRADEVTVRLRSTDSVIADLSGSRLDGDTNGIAGGTYRTQFRVLPGDVDQDGRVDTADVASARRRLNSGLGDEAYALSHDVDGSGRIDASDLAAIEERVGTTLPGYVPPMTGDANQDGRFNSTDLVFIWQRGKYRTGEFASWEDGDWNRDGLFDEADLIRAFQEGHYTDAAFVDFT
jgi:hypothetical protein